MSRSLPANGADGISDVEGKVARVAMSELGNERVSMRLLEPGSVAFFESEFTSLQRTRSRRIPELFNRALLLKILLSRRVQLIFGRQRCPAQRFPPGLLTAFISSPFFCRCTVSRAMSVEHCGATQNDRRQSHQHKQAQLPDHNSRQPQTNLSIYAAIEQRPARHRFDLFSREIERRSWESISTIHCAAFLLLQ
jgi:hypothetical protein